MPDLLKYVPVNWRMCLHDHWRICLTTGGYFMPVPLVDILCLSHWKIFYACPTGGYFMPVPLEDMPNHWRMCLIIGGCACMTTGGYA
jgi:hypothetical protein